ncbi:MAG: carbohydrate ABC transporter permease, partial [Candidatus Heritagella sp.]
GVTVGLIWNELYLKVVPVFGQALGIEFLSKSMLGNPVTAFWAVLIVNLWQGCAQPTVLLIAGLQSVPKDVYEAATIDGANAWQRFKSITVPYLLPIISIIVITTAKGGLTIFDYIKALTDGGPNKATRAVGLLIYNDAMQGGKFSYAVAESMILFVLVAIISVFTIKGNSGKEAGDA